MQIEPPETIHFPIHSLQELQEQRGGLRVSALGSAAPPAQSVLNPGSISLRRASAKLNGRAAALADPLGHTRLFAYALGGAAVTRRRRPQLHDNTYSFQSGRGI